MANGVGSSKDAFDIESLGSEWPRAMGCRQKGGGVVLNVHAAWARRKVERVQKIHCGKMILGGRRRTRRCILSLGCGESSLVQ